MCVYIYPLCSHKCQLCVCDKFSNSFQSCSYYIGPKNEIWSKSVWCIHASEIKPWFVQIMVCRLFGTQQFICFFFVKGIIGDRFRWNLIQNATIGVEVFEFENVFCKMATVLARPQCVNSAEHTVIYLSLLKVLWAVCSRNVIITLTS